MSDNNFDTKRDLWRHLRGDVCKLEGRMAVSLLVFFILGIAYHILLRSGRFYDDVGFFSITAAICFLILFYFSFLFRRVMVLRVYLNHLEAALNSELSSNLYLLETRFAKAFYFPNLPFVLLASISFVAIVIFFIELFSFLPVLDMGLRSLFILFFLVFGILFIVSIVMSFSLHKKRMGETDFNPNI